VKTLLMTGVTGLIGRWTAAELTREGHCVVGLARGAAAREADLKRWISDHGGNRDNLKLLEGDLSAPGLGLTMEARGEARKASSIYNLGGHVRWDEDAALKRRVNYAAVVDLIALAEEMPTFERFVQASGYLIASDQYWSALRFTRRALVASEVQAEAAFRTLRRRKDMADTSNLEADILLRRRALSGFPVTIVNPAGVIGHSRTGEAQQLFWLEGLITGIAQGTLAVLPGTSRDWTPLVTVDYLAKFLARAPFLPWSTGEEFTVLRKESPTLLNLAKTIAEELRRPAPTRRAPVWLLKPLLRAGLDKVTGIPVESLSFINSFTFDTSTADRAADELGLTPPGDIEGSLRLSIRYYLAQQTRRGPA
jgi:dihydroflavonol-4-reductase